MPATTGDNWGVVMMFGIAAMLVNVWRWRHYRQRKYLYLVIASLGLVAAVGVKLVNGPDMYLWLTGAVGLVVTFFIYAFPPADQINKNNQQWLLATAILCAVLMAAVLAYGDLDDGLMFGFFTLWSLAA